jgi:membrane associated rhomboid family serine protease
VIPLHDNVPTRRFPVLTVALIVINVLAFLWELQAPDQVRPTVSGQRVIVPGFTAVTAEYGFVPCELVQRCRLGDDVVDFGGGQVVEVRHVPVWETLFTSMFMHGGWEHLLGNMLFLWIFGNNVEDRIGRKLFLLFYLLGGLAATALQLAVDQTSAVPNIGASGAIAAVLGGYIVLYPRALVLSWVGWFLVPVPAVAFLGIWFILQALSASTIQVGASGGGVAYFAHIGGFIFGLATIKLWARGSPGPTLRTRY